MWSVNDLAVAGLDVFALTSHEKAVGTLAISVFSAIGRCRLI